MIGPLDETTVWNKKKEKVDILFLLRSDQESKYLQYRDLTKIRNILDETPLTSQLSFDLADWWDSSKYLDTTAKDPAGPQFDYKVIKEGKFDYMGMFRRSIAMFSSSRVVITDRLHLIELGDRTEVDFLEARGYFTNTLSLLSFDH